MTSLTLALDNIDVSENTEQISKLFPKCRPRSDINLNPIISGRDHECTENSANTVMNIDSENDRWMADGSCNISRDNLSQRQSPGDEDVIDHKLPGGTYKLRDSRIIEIAGGREIYSQSRSKAVRKSRNAGLADDGEKKLQKSPLRQGVWELRSRNNEAKKLRNSREYTETVFSSEVCSVTHEQDREPSPEPERIASPKMNYASEVVVFDDIGDTWPSDDNKRYQNEHFETERFEELNHTATNIFNNSDTDSDKVTKVIGSLPIAVYEGSPRRYGPRQMESNYSHPQLPSAQSLLASPSVYPPRPGFPQRIINTPSPNENETNLNIENNSFNKNSSSPTATSTFDYLYEFSETRKVLEEFFKCPPPEEENRLEAEFQDLEYELRRQASESGNSYVGQRLAKERRGEGNEFCMRIESPRKCMNNSNDHDITEHENNFLDLSIGTGSSGDLGETEVGLQVGHSRNFTLSPETTDCDSNCGDLDSEVSLMLMENDMGPSGGLLGSNTDLTIPGDSLRLYSSMPVLEDGLSSGHASDTDNNNPTVMLMKRQITEIEREINQGICKTKPSNKSTENGMSPNKESSLNSSPIDINGCGNNFDEPKMDSLEKTPPPPAPAPHRLMQPEKSSDVEAAIKDIRLTLQRTKTLPLKCHPEEDPEENVPSPIWVPRQRGMSAASGDSDRKVNSGEEGTEENDTDLETDRLLGQQRTDDQGFYDDKGWRKPKSRTIMPALSLTNPKQMLNAMDEGTLPLVPAEPQNSNPSSPTAVSEKSQSPQSQKGSVTSNKLKKEKDNKKKGRNKEDVIQRSVLIEGVLFRARYLGSTQLVCEGQPTKTTRMMQAEEAVSRIKAPDGESQPSTEVDLFISTEKIMVLNTDLKEIMMDHALRTISYIADIGDLVVLMARRRFVPHEMDEAPKINRTPKMICHVFESEEAQFIAQSIGQAFQVAYMEFLKANGIEDHSFVKEMDYQEVLNSQEIFGDELQMFAKKEMQKEVVVPKAKGEILGVVIVESGWGSMLPTVVIANLAPAGAAARCGQLNIGDQIIAINGVSLVGLPLSTCQTYIKNSKNQTVVKLTVVPCAPVVEVKIKRPDTKYQLGFSVQNGVICSLLRGGIAERGGVRVGHRIIEINNQSVVAVPHEKIVNLLATSVGEILMKTMPTSMFRLLTGQENPVYI
ncbi:amyloid-beta A4 precursor protein-binding family A member 2 isoform X3 [Aethina tumida]|uniref:amyloid-beta A4 precursor protein-binding family A member 2 isoform X3 n=1 Tax=Aethina tumida TaxID=116153 RepID=UPI00096B4BA9|nr:amyloid-beta A4 precursor protein-binding family A member 2 isoform X3 [Aethina tumida]